MIYDFIGDRSINREKSYPIIGGDYLTQLRGHVRAAIDVDTIVAVGVGVLVANGVGLGGPVSVGVGAGVGSPTQATDTNRTTDETRGELRIRRPDFICLLLVASCR